MSNLTCAECGCILTENSACEFYGNTYCSDCLEDLTVCCERCGRRIYRDDVCYHSDASDKPYCEDCIGCNDDDSCEEIFRGTLKYNTLIATLQMVNRICDLAIFLSDSEIRNVSWPEFVVGIKEPELIQYLKERRLYVSEPVETEEEIWYVLSFWYFGL